MVRGMNTAVAPLQCPECFSRTDELSVDSRGKAVCFGCFVPAVPRVDHMTVFEAIFVAPPNAKDVTPR